MLTLTRLSFALLVAVVILATWGLTRGHAQERYIWPSVPMIEASLGLRGGVVLPKYVVAGGRRFAVTYVRGRELSRGAYSVILQLSPQ